MTKVKPAPDAAALTDAQMELVELLMIGLPPCLVMRRMNITRRVFDGLYTAALRKIEERR